MPARATPATYRTRGTQCTVALPVTAGDRLDFLLKASDIEPLPICFVGKTPTKQNGNTIWLATRYG